nr:MAG TPA: hypothetical protein [Caudoviricetes sp.]
MFHEILTLCSTERGSREIPICLRKANVLI